VVDEQQLVNNMHVAWHMVRLCFFASVHQVLQGARHGDIMYLPLGMAEGMSYSLPVNGQVREGLLLFCLCAVIKCVDGYVWLRRLAGC